MATPGPANLYAAEMWERLGSNPAYCGGKRRVKETRYSVAFILTLIGNGYEVADIPKSTSAWKKTTFGPVLGGGHG